MIDVSLDNLKREIAAAIKKRDECLAGVKESKERYQGPDRAGAGENSIDSPENIEFQVVSTRIPMMAFDVPSVRCDSPIFEVAEEVAAFERGLNRWISESDTRQVLLEAAYEFNFSWTCLLVSRRPQDALGEVEMRGGTGVPMWPYMTCIPTDQAFRDPYGGPYKMRYAGHIMAADKDNLLRACKETPEEGWNEEVIRAMADDSGVSSLRRAQGDVPTRKEIAYYQVWVADAPIDWETECLDEDGNEFPKEKRYLYNGRLFYIPVETSAPVDAKRKRARENFIRKSQPFFGPPSGPYVFGGEHVIPGEPYLMSTLAPNAATIRLLNECVKTVNDGVVAYKRFSIVDEMQEGLADVITNAKNGTTQTVAGFDSSKFAEIETGGVTNQSLMHVDVLRDRTDRNIGIDDGQKGKPDAEASATAVAVAADSAGAKSGFCKHQFTDLTQRALEIVGFYLWYDEEFAMPISLQDAQAMGENLQNYIKVDPKTGRPLINPKTGEVQYSQPMLFGGTDKARSYASLQMEIEPLSTERMSDAVAARNAATLTQTMATTMPLVLQNPQGQWDVYFKAMAKYTRIPEMAHLINMQAAAQMAGSQALAQYAASLSEQTPELSGAKNGPTPPSPGKATTPGASQPRVQPAAAPKPTKPGGMQGKATGGSAGDAAKKKVSAA